MNPSEMNRVIDAHFAAETSGDLDGIVATVSDAVSHEMLVAGMESLSGRDAVRTFYGDLLRDLRLDGYTSTRRLFGPDHAWEEGVVEATAVGRPFGLPGEGRTITFRLNHLFEFGDGLISREVGMLDVAAILGQLSAPSPPVAPV